MVILNQDWCDELVSKLGLVVTHGDAHYRVARGQAGRVVIIMGTGSYSNKSEGETHIIIPDGMRYDILTRDISPRPGENEVSIKARKDDLTALAESAETCLRDINYDKDSAIAEYVDGTSPSYRMRQHADDMIMMVGIAISFVMMLTTLTTESVGVFVSVLLQMVFMMGAIANNFDVLGKKHRLTDVRDTTPLFGLGFYIATAGVLGYTLMTTTLSTAGTIITSYFIIFGSVPTIIIPAFAPYVIEMVAIKTPPKYGVS